MVIFIENQLSCIDDLDKAEDMTVLLKAMSHPYRLIMIKGLMECGGCNVKNIQRHLELTQPAISQHLMCLKKAGIVSCKRQGNEIIYSVCSETARNIIDSLFK